MITFEKTAAACEWSKSDWAFRLIPLLTGKARAGYVHMGIDDSLDYDSVKSAILRKYDINSETFEEDFVQANASSSVSQAKIGTSGCPTICSLIGKSPRPRPVLFF